MSFLHPIQLVRSQLLSPGFSRSIRLIEIIGTDTDTCIWSMVEVCVVIVCACLPTLCVLFKRILYFGMHHSLGSDQVNLAQWPSSTRIRVDKEISVGSDYV